jgi:hypothetical protein
MQYGRTVHETIANGHPPYCNADATHTVTYGNSQVDYCERHATLECNRWSATLTEIGA